MEENTLCNWQKAPPHPLPPFRIRNLIVRPLGILGDSGAVSRFQVKAEEPLGTLTFSAILAIL